MCISFCLQGTTLWRWRTWLRRASWVAGVGLNWYHPVKPPKAVRSGSASSPTSTSPLIRDSASTTLFFLRYVNDQQQEMLTSLKNLAVHHHVSGSPWTPERVWALQWWWRAEAGSQKQTAISPLSQPCIVFISVSLADQSRIIVPSEPAPHLGCSGAAGSEVEEMGGFMFA